MRILIISNDQTDEYHIRNHLSYLSEKDSLVFAYSFHEAKHFIQNHIEKHQQPLDLIIAFNHVLGETANSFRNWIKSDGIRQRTYSQRDFNLKSIPIILIAGENENRSIFRGYEKVLDYIGVEKLNLFKHDFISAVKSWRSSVLDEMDNLGIRFNSGVIDYSFYFSSNKKANSTTKILSENFKRFPRRLNYQWLILNSKQIEESIDEFIKLLKRAERLGKKGDEKAFHKFFNNNKHFILRDNYSKYWYEAKLEKEGKFYEEPDFMLKPNFNYQTDLSLIEVKLPNEGFIKSRKYHRGPLSKFVNHLIQVNDYKDYLESEQYKESINKVFGYVPTRTEFNLLIGREKEKLDKIDDLNKVMRQFNQNHIQLISYDNLKEYQVKFLDRIGLLEIK